MAYKEYILAIETATSVCSVAVLRGSEVYSEVSEISRQRHNEILPGLTEQALLEGGIQPARLSAIAISIGPGSFSGLRVGLSFSKGLAIASDSQIVTVPTLDALALCMLRQDDYQIDIDGEVEEIYFCPMTIARKNEAFGRLFKFDAGELKPVCGVFLGGSELLTEPILAENGPVLTSGSNKKHVFFAGEGADMICEGVELSPQVSHWQDLHTAASTVGELGAVKWQSVASNPPPFEELEPLYLKEFIVNKAKR